MAEAALKDEDGSESEMVRRMMVRSLRLVETPAAASDANRPPPLAFLRDRAPPPSAEIERLKTELMVMKAVLRAQQTEVAQLRACVAALADPESEELTPEAQAVQLRWAALVDRLLNLSH